MLLADIFPDWVGIAALISAIATSIVFIVRELSRNKSTNKKEEQELEQEGESYAIRQLKGIIRDMQAQRKQENAECESRIRLLQQEVKEVRESERLTYAETQRLTAVNKIFEQQINELRAALSREGINVISTDHTPLPDAPEGERDV